MRSHADEPAWADDTRAAEWITSRLHSHAQSVGSFVPDCFEAYARILHPAIRRDGERLEKVRWREVARTAGRPLTAGTRFDQIAETHTDVESPAEGTLDCDELAVVVALLAPATATPDACWFAIWEGYGWMQGPPAAVQLPPGSAGFDELSLGPPPPSTARVEIPERRLVLYQGPLAAATLFCEAPLAQSPTLWWPSDRSWCVASEIDFHSTYLGGTRELVSDLVRDERLETLPIEVEAPITD